MKTAILMFTFFLVASVTHAIENDYCVGDPSLPKGPSGYSCKDPSKVSVNDFVYTGLRNGDSTNNIFGTSVKFAFVDQFLGLNGLGISMARLDFALGGVVPLHTHRTSEMFLCTRGSIIAGFIDTNNTAFYKRLEVGDVMIFPESMLHFQINVGIIPALAFVALNSPNPGIQIVDTALFAGNLPADIAAKIMLLDRDQVTKLRKAFGNTA